MMSSITSLMILGSLSKAVVEMARPKKEGVKVSYVLEKQVAEALDKFCDETGRSKTKVIEMAVKEFIEKHKDTQV